MYEELDVEGVESPAYFERTLLLLPWSLMPVALVLMCARRGRRANIGLTAAVATFRAVDAAVALKMPLARASMAERWSLV